MLTKLHFFGSFFFLLMASERQAKAQLLWLHFADSEIEAENKKILPLFAA